MVRSTSGSGHESAMWVLDVREYWAGVSFAYTDIGCSSAVSLFSGIIMCLTILLALLWI